MQPAGTLEEAVGQLQRSVAARAAAKDDRHELVVAERRDAEPLQLFAWPIVLRDLFHSAILKCS
jgi:hypothetical protein